MHGLAGIRRINADFAARATPVQQAPEPVLTNPAPLGVDLRVIQKSDRTHIFPVTLKGVIFLRRRSEAARLNHTSRYELFCSGYGRRARAECPQRFRTRDRIDRLTRRAA